MKELYEAVKTKTQLENSSKYQSSKLLEISSSPISSIGQFKLITDEDHLNPQKPLQQFEYDEIFSFAISSEASGETTYQNKNGKRLLQEDDEETKEEKKLSFTVKVISHSSSEIAFQVKF